MVSFTPYLLPTFLYSSCICHPTFVQLSWYWKLLFNPMRLCSVLGNRNIRKFSRSWQKFRLNKSKGCLDHLKSERSSRKDEKMENYWILYEGLMPLWTLASDLCLITSFQGLKTYKCGALQVGGVRGATGVKSRLYPQRIQLIFKRFTHFMLT